MRREMAAGGSVQWAVPRLKCTRKCMQRCVPRRLLRQPSPPAHLSLLHGGGLLTLRAAVEGDALQGIQLAVDRAVR